MKVTQQIVCALESLDLFEAQEVLKKWITKQLTPTDSLSSQTINTWLLS